MSESNALYVKIMEMKDNLDENHEINLFLSDDLMPTISHTDQISLFSQMIIIERRESVSIIPLSKVKMVRCGKRWI